MQNFHKRDASSQDAHNIILLSNHTNPPRLHVFWSRSSSPQTNVILDHLTHAKRCANSTTYSTPWGVERWRNDRTFPDVSLQPRPHYGHWRATSDERRCRAKPSQVPSWKSRRLPGVSSSPDATNPRHNRLFKAHSPPFSWQHKQGKAELPRSELST